MILPVKERASLEDCFIGEVVLYGESLPPYPYYRLAIHPKIPVTLWGEYPITDEIKIETRNFEAVKFAKKMQTNWSWWYWKRVT